MSFKLPKLSYSYKDFEPYIDRKTMEIHYTKHHAGYTNNLNKAIEGTDMLNLSIEEILRRANIEKSIIRNNSGGFYNHNFFWKILIPHSESTLPSKYMNEILQKSFKTFDCFKEKFHSAAMNRFGSGWVWLCVNRKKLTICSTANQDNPLMLGIGCEGIPILGLDVWEHAYYLQYQNRRNDYISSFWKIVNWKKVEENYKSAMRIRIE
ncbi:MAG: superoxide dismutase [Flavobacteriales bacterium]|jgi:Fe-Mn family superoxide dismutase|uniref:superoxide dismutase n=1 Tax=Blattabacterium sp. (Mastotermes darwiniensis) TaxID=39768 RepID=UPI000231DE3E|nr:superoxide dismutase [Blattabacterium sp. (Mastotermes darwiniensis)]AER40626.1 superoxide dismutase, iron/manganese-dependent [Blattabacterium sp. (Mastotermes darwiniensis) str. MADAR]MDR1804737.1 superoxide dismutase [Flavobacteriales bacterium]